MTSPDRLGSEYYKQYLTVQGRICYDQICRQLNNRDYSGQTTIMVTNGKNASVDCFSAVKAVRDDHPEYFFLGNKIEFLLHGKKATVNYQVVYPGRDIERVNRLLDKKITGLTNGIWHLSAYMREKTIYERIAKEMKYKNHDDVRDHSVVGPLLMSEGVCEGQNALLILCLRRAGIPCIKIFGKTDTDDWHCWTIAWIDGKPVHCDVTWDNAEKGVVYFDYFNLSDEQMKKDHFKFSDYNIPRCDAEDMDYYHRYRLNVRSFKDLCRRLSVDYSLGTAPIMMHFDYLPESGSFFDEIGKAVKHCRIRDGYCARSNSKKENIALLIGNR